MGTFDREKAFLIMNAYAAAKSIFIRAYSADDEEKLIACLNNAKEHYLNEMQELFERCANDKQRTKLRN